MGKELKSPYTKNLDKDPRFTDAEIELFRKLDEDILKSFRVVFYQDPLTDEQYNRLKTTLTPEFVDLLAKVFAPGLDFDAPVFSMPNRWTNPRYEGVLCAETKLAIVGRQKAVKFMERGIGRLRDIVSGVLSDIPLEVDIRMKKDYSKMTAEEAKIEVVAMQDAIQYLESGIMALFAYAMSPEDKDNLMKKIRKNSAE